MCSKYYLWDEILQNICDAKEILAFQFSQFETEKVFDTVQILGGGRTEETAVNIATLSGSLTQELRDKSFTSASNFMIIKFRSDESVEKAVRK